MHHAQLAQLCSLSYPVEKYKPSPLDGDPRATAVGSLAAKAYVIDAGDEAWLVCRGTADRAGWGQDLDAVWRKTAHGRVHDGMWECWQSVRGQALTAIAGRPAQ